MSSPDLTPNQKLKARMHVLRRTRTGQDHTGMSESQEVNQAMAKSLYNTIPHSRKIERRAEKYLTPEQYIEYCKQKPVRKSLPSTNTPSSSSISGYSSILMTTDEQNHKSRPLFVAPSLTAPSSTKQEQ